jgi:trimeric autotransporter adhesin
MDEITLYADVVSNCDGALTGSVEFFIDGVSYGSADVFPVPDQPSVVRAMMVKQVVNYPNDPETDSYDVEAVFTPSNTDYIGSEGTTLLNVRPRTTIPFIGNGYYTGDEYAWTTGPNSSTATLTMSAAFVDDNTPKGDLRGGLVTFYIVKNGVPVPIPSAQNLPVSLVDMADGTIGFASAIVQLNIGSLNVESFQIAVGIKRAYENNPMDVTSSAIVTVAKPGLSGVLMGAGELCNTNSGGLIRGESSLTTRFSFDVIFNKKFTNPQGKVNLWIVSNYNSGGILDGRQHFYIVSSNAISLLSVKDPNASFSSKANVVEQLPDGTIVPVEGGSILQVAMTQPAC